MITGAFKKIKSSNYAYDVFLDKKLK